MDKIVTQFAWSGSKIKEKCPVLGNFLGVNYCEFDECDDGCELADACFQAYVEDCRMLEEYRRQNLERLRSNPGQRESLAAAVREWADVKKSEQEAM